MLPQSVCGQPAKRGVPSLNRIKNSGEQRIQRVDSLRNSPEMTPTAYNDPDASTPAAKSPSRPIVTLCGEEIETAKELLVANSRGMGNGSRRSGLEYTAFCERCVFLVVTECFRVYSKAHQWTCGGF